MEIVEDEGAWVASVPDLPGCNSYGTTITEAVENVQEAKKLWLEGQFQVGASIPEPEAEDEYSGKFVLRIPKVLHRSLAYEARKQGVSLNHYASHLLSQRQPLEAFEQAVQCILDLCPTSRTTWLYSRHSHDKALMIGKTVNADLLVYLRKPAAKGAFKAGPAYMRRQYALPEPR
jgi:antitoxin HicB